MSSRISSMIAKNTIKSNFIRALDFAIFLNCFTYVILFKMRQKPNLLKEIEKDPISTCADVTIEGTMFSLAGLVVSNIFPPQSNILFNGFLLYVNYTKWKYGKGIFDDYHDNSDNSDNNDN